MPRAAIQPAVRHRLATPLAAHINMIAVDPIGQGNLRALPLGAGPTRGLSVNYHDSVDTNMANAGSVKTITGAGPDITVASNYAAAHTVIEVLDTIILPHSNITPHFREFNGTDVISQ